MKFQNYEVFATITYRLLLHLETLQQWVVLLLEHRLFCVSILKLVLDYTLN